MKTMKVIDRKYLPGKYPIWPSVTLWLLMDRLHANQLAWGIVGTIWAIIWVLAITVSIKEKSVHPTELKAND